MSCAAPGVSRSGQDLDDDRIVRAIRIWNAILGGMEGTEYRVMLSGSDRYYVELTRQGESPCTTCDFATQSAAQDWIDQDREREGALDRRLAATPASKREPVTSRRSSPSSHSCTS